ncbi:MAG: quercetin 2,3-dioxygenase [Thermomicrobiales bacterium]|nr:quercetin 2,3-dioxygenase [Thermomicrobiales bacterium]
MLCQDDNLLLRNQQGITASFEPGATLAMGRQRPILGGEAIARATLVARGRDLPYAADLQRVVGARDVTLMAGACGEQRRGDGAWRFGIVRQAVGDMPVRWRPAPRRRPGRSLIERRMDLMGTTRTPLTLGPSEGEALWCVGVLTVVKADAEQTAGAYSLIEDLAPKGVGTPLHRHREDDEAFYVLEGEMSFYLGHGEPIRACAGSFVHVPGGTVHAFRVESETARYLILTTPQHERFYRAIAEPAQARSIPLEAPMDMEMIGAACEAYAVESVGPTPEAQGQRDAMRLQGW